MNAYQVQQDPTAVMGKRIVAWIIDMVIVVALSIGVFAALGDSESFSSDEEAEVVCTFYNLAADNPKLCVNVGSTVYAADGSDALMIYILPAVWFLLISGTLIQGLAGGTPGKLVMGLRTINRDTGQIAGVGKSFIRSLLWIIDGLPCYLVGFITGLVTAGHRRVGDMAAGTLVVGKADVGRPPMVPGLTQNAPPPGAYYGAAGAPGAPEATWTPPAEPPAPTWDPPAAPSAFDNPDPAPVSTIADAPAEATPTAEAEPPADTPVAESAASAAEGGPTWDEARGTYIQWDADSTTWVQWDEGAQQWKPIE